jgi:hypothetical protein
MAGGNGRELYSLHCLKAKGNKLPDKIFISRKTVCSISFFICLVGLDNSPAMALFWFVGSEPSKSMTWIYHIKIYLPNYNLKRKKLPKIFIIVNFKIYKINSIIYKLTQIYTLIIKKNINMYHIVYK